VPSSGRWQAGRWAGARATPCLTSVELIRAYGVHGRFRGHRQLLIYVRALRCSLRVTLYMTRRFNY